MGAAERTVCLSLALPLSAKIFSMTNEEHNRYVAYSFFAYAGLQLFWLVVMLVWFGFIFGSFPSRPGEPEMPAAFFGIIFVFLLVFTLIFTAPAVLAGWAMLKRKEWARVAGIVGAVLAAASMPVGTGVCVYALWFLLGENWKEVYAAEAQRDHSVLSLRAGHGFQQASEFKTPEQDWMKRPPDWRS